MVGVLMFSSCGDLIDTMAKVELNIRVDGTSLPFSSECILVATNVEDAGTTVTKNIGMLKQTALVQLESGTWMLEAHMYASDVLQAKGKTTVTVHPGRSAKATINVVGDNPETIAQIAKVSKLW